MRFRIMRFPIYAEVRSCKNDSPFMPFSQIIPHLCGYKNMNFLNFASLYLERLFILLIITEISLSSTYSHINEDIKGSQVLMDNKIQ